MTTGAADPVFIDTNVLVFSTVTAAPWHQNARTALAVQQNAGAEIWISRQILREFLATLSRPQTFTPAFTPDELANAVALLQAQFRTAEDNGQVTDELIKLLRNIAIGGKQVHDANIVATMLTYGIPRLLTNNTADFARFSHLITVVPLV